MCFSINLSTSRVLEFLEDCLILLTQILYQSLGVIGLCRNLTGLERENILSLPQGKTEVLFSKRESGTVPVGVADNVVHT